MSSAETAPPRGRSVRSAKVSVAMTFLALGGMIVFGRQAGMGGDARLEGPTADWAAALAASAGPNALEGVETAEMRRRFEARVFACTGVGASTWPLRIDDIAGSLRLRYGDEVTPLMNVDFARLKEQGPTGGYLRRSRDSAAPAGAAEAVLKAGLSGIYAPGRPCPKG